MSSRKFLPVILLVALLPLLTGCNLFGDDGTKEVVNQIQEVGKLELIEQRSEEIILISGSGETPETIGSISEAMTYLDDLFRIGDRVGVYSFGHYSIAYLDLTQLTIDDVKLSRDKTVHLTLPAIKVEPIGRSGDIKLLHERVTGTKKKITNEERSKIQAKATEQAIARLKPGTPNYTDLVNRAQDQATAYFKGMLRTRGYENVIVEFKKS